MSRTVTAIYDTRDEADRALNLLGAEVPLAQAGVYGGDPQSLDALRRLSLTPDERAACEGKLAPGEYMLVAQLGISENPERAIAVLERIADDPHGSHDRPPQPPADAETGGSPPMPEERIPLVADELHVGTREVVRGGARVHTRVEQSPTMADVELLEELARTNTRPVNRRVSETELAGAGLLRERLIEIAEVREEAVVSKEVFVREEVVVTKTTERRIQQVEETIRRTEADVQELHGDRAAARHD